MNTKYIIEWKVTVNNRIVSKDTEQDVVLSPSAYWGLFLRPKLEKLSCKKLAENRPVKSEDTNIMVSVIDHSRHDLTKRFDDMGVGWTVIGGDSSYRANCCIL